MRKFIYLLATIITFNISLFFRNFLIQLNKDTFRMKNSPTQSEGEINTSPRRLDWAEKTHDESTRSLLNEDAKYFIHQSMLI